MNNKKRTNKQLTKQTTHRQTEKQTDRQTDRQTNASRLTARGVDSCRGLALAWSQGSNAHELSQTTKQATTAPTRTHPAQDAPRLTGDPGTHQDPHLRGTDPSGHTTEKRKNHGRCRRCRSRRPRRRCFCWSFRLWAVNQRRTSPTHLPT